MQSRSGLKALAFLAMMMFSVPAFAGGITVNTFNVVEDSGAITTWRVGDSSSVTGTLVADCDTFFASADGFNDSTWL